MENQIVEEKTMVSKKTIVRFIIFTLFTITYFILRFISSLDKTGVENFSSLKLQGSIIDYLLFACAFIILIIILPIKAKFYTKIKLFLFNNIDWYDVVPITVTILTILLTCFFTFSKVEGSSMNNTFHDNDIVFINLTEKIDKYDVVICYVNKEDNTNVSHDDYYIKRVIGVSGDTINYVNGVLTVNGVVIDESLYLDSTTIANNTPCYNNVIDFVVPNGTYFVMGDKRNHSNDSRSIGCIKEENIVGVAYMAPELFQNLIGGTN